MDRTILIRSAEPADYTALQMLLTLPGVIHGALQGPFTSQEKSGCAFTMARVR